MSDRGERPPRGDEQELTGVIGLPRDTVRVVPYHDAWPALFEREAAVLREHIGNLVVDIQHVGSTSVPGLDAKPIIDIGIALESLASIPPHAGDRCSISATSIVEMAAAMVGICSSGRSHPRCGPSTCTS